jgi:hypothetical protein
MPRSIGAIIPWIAHSRMLGDFSDTHKWTNTQRRDHLSTLDKRYTFRQFMGSDGRWRFAVDEEPPDVKIPPQSPPLETPPSDPSQEDLDSEAGKTTSIQLQELANQQSRARN